MSAASPADRASRIAELKSGKIFDLLVIGGGATGCGIAVDAASRGLSVALVERQDFAEGTSSRSTKLLHGGVRYLEAAVRRLDKAHFKLVREALHERGALINNAPHLSNRLALVTPLYSWWQVPYVYAGLKLYDFLSGRRSIGASKLLSRAETMKALPGLRAEGLKAGVLYYDGQFADSRLVISLVQTARQQGAVLANQIEASGLRHDQAGRVNGAELRDRLTGERWDIRARAVINATGPFADSIVKMDDREAKDILTVSSGVHIVLDRTYTPPATGLLIPKTDDGRVLFILPWQDHALIGTTDEKATLEDHPRASEADVAYLLSYVRRYLSIDATEADIKARWSGLRPLAYDPKAKNSAELARDHVLIEAKSGLITISGGKWTTYRLMAEQTVDHAVHQAGLTASPCRTETLRLWGGATFDPRGDEVLMRDYGLEADVARHLNRTYGDQGRLVAELARQGWGKRLHPDHPHIEADVVHAVRAEDAVHAIDVLARRLGLALLDTDAAREAAPKVVALMSEELGWDEARRQAELDLTALRLDGAL
ncbi:MAG TPA: FAD-dependent oxidoreductase [Magnetospirillaceae bacterium]|nr:FAD-dependent oxidoreductase [Magnetospirillaceae bacterium]